MPETKKQPWYEKTIIWLIYSLAIGIPLVFSTAFYSNFAAPKLLLLRGVTLIVMLLWAWKSFIEEKITYRKGKFLLFLGAYAAVLVLTTLTSVNIFSSLLGTETRFLGVFTQLNFLLIAWLVYNFLRTSKQLKTFLTIMSCTGVVVLMVYGYLQYFGAFNADFGWSQSPQDRVFGTLGHSNHFGAYLGMCILLSFGIIPLLKKKWQKIFLGMCAIASGGVVLLTGSRGVLVATVLSVFIVSIIQISSSKKTKVAIRKYVFHVMIALVIIASLVFIFRDAISKIPVIQRLQQGAVTVEEGITPDRLSWWYSSLEMFKDRPLQGFGVSTFRDVYNKYRRYDYKVPGPGDIQYQISPESSHNDYIDILATQGIIGLAAYFALLIFVLSQLDKKLLLGQNSTMKNNEQFLIALGIKGALLVYLIQVLVNFGVVDTLTIFYLLLGASVSISIPEKMQEIRLKPWFKEAVLAGFLLLLIYGGFSMAHEAIAEYSYKNAIVEESFGKIENARGWYEEMIKQQPFRYEYYEAFAGFAFKNAMASEIDPEYTKQYLLLALQNYQKASMLNSYHPSTFYNMGITSIQLGRMSQNDSYVSQGVNALQEAIRLSPNNPLYAYQSAKIFEQIGQTDLAIKNYTEVVRLNPQFMDAQSRLDQLITSKKS